MTELAYLVDLPAAYVRTFAARITALPPGSVVLDRTYFYPAGGGQPSDRGTLRLPSGDSMEVLDVTKSGASVLHRVRGSPAVARQLVAGLSVEGTIDWDRRLRHMRLHTAQHLLSARIFTRTGLRTRRANLAGTRATLDLDGALPEGSLDVLARDLDSAVDHPRSVTIRYISRSEWDRHPESERSGLVPLPAQVDPVRVVEIEASDICPCGGTHVRSTGEIGRVTLSTPTRLEEGASRVELTLLDPGSTTPPS